MARSRGSMEEKDERLRKKKEIKHEGHEESQRKK
jgi:hypothetical protein